MLSHELPVLPLPIAEWIPDRLDLTPSLQSPVSGKLEERIQKYLDATDASISGQRGHSTTFRVLCAVYHGFNLTENQLRDAFQYYNETKCEPAWHDREFDHKIAEVLKSTSEKPRGYLRETTTLSKEFLTEVDLTQLLLNLENRMNPERRISRPSVIPASKTLQSMPEELMYVPGFVDQVTQFSLSAAPQPHRQLALLGAIALQSYLISRKVTSEIGAFRPSLYLLGLADTGAGKDYPRAVNQYVLNMIGESENIAEECASGEALEDLILERNRIMFNADEINFTLANMSGTESRYKSLESLLLKLYSEAYTAHRRRIRATQRGVPIQVPVVHEPALVLFGTSTPQRFFRSLTLDMIEGGLASRCIIVTGEPRGRGQDRKELSSMPTDILDVANYWHEYTYPPSSKTVLVDAGYPPTLYPIPVTLAAREQLAQFRTYCDDQNIELAKGNHIASAMWTRTYETAGRLMLVYACSKNHTVPVIDTDAVTWASQLVIWAAGHLIHMISQNVAESPFHAIILKAANILRENGGKMNKRELYRKMHLPSREMDELIRTMSESDLIEPLVNISDGNKPSYLISLKSL